MRSIERLLVASALLLVSLGSSFAGSNVNEVGAILVYPIVSSVVSTQETYITITNAGSAGITAHVSFVDGFEGTPQFPNPNYCFECDFSLEMSGNDTDVLVIAKNPLGGTDIFKSDGEIMHSCSHSLGMFIVTIEDENGQTLTDNVLLGSEVIVDYSSGYAISIPAIPFQGADSGNGDRSYAFDDAEYRKLPRIIAADFIAPDLGNVGAVTAELALFTLGFDRGFPPRTDCSVNGMDADENVFSRSLQFGCWTLTSLWDISPEFAYPNLGMTALASDTHGWLQLDCSVDVDDNGSFDIEGGVHGAIIQKAMGPGLFGPGAIIRRGADAPPNLPNSAAWARILYQSVTTGDALTLRLN